jgi:hypothetical protein
MRGNTATREIASSNPPAHPPRPASFMVGSKEDLLILGSMFYLHRLVMLFWAQ